jgi:hypothetical protein
VVFNCQGYESSTRLRDWFTLIEWGLALKIISVLIALSVLFAGCYSESALTKNEEASDEVVVVFYLNDGSIVESQPGEHLRIENGYQVAGQILKDGRRQGSYEGIVRDASIQKVTEKRLNIVRTSIGVVLGVVGTVLIVGIVVIAANGGFMVTRH